MEVLLLPDKAAIGALVADAIEAPVSSRPQWVDDFAGSSRRWDLREDATLRPVSVMPTSRQAMCRSVNRHHKRE